MTAHLAPTTLRTSEAVVLAHGLVFAVARQAGVRVLFIKGLTVQELGLRPVRSVADVDVLVDPDGVRLLADALVQLGWHERPALTLPEKGRSHATTLVHDAWPCDLDLHAWMRGLYGDPRAVFDRLWADRVLVAVGGIEVPTPTPPGSALIAAVNCLRDPFVPFKMRELSAIGDAALGSFTAEDRALTLELSDSLRCRTTARPYLERIVGAALPAADDLDRRELAEWARLTVKENSALNWWTAMTEQTWRGRVVGTLRFLWPDEYSLRRARPQTAPGARGAFLGRLSRVGTGLAKIPRALALWRRRKAELAQQGRKR